MRKFIKNFLAFTMLLTCSYLYSLTLEGREKACNAGDIKQCVILGRAYYTSLILDNSLYDRTKEKCSKGDSEECENLNRMKKDAKQSIIDYPKAFEFYNFE